MKTLFVLSLTLISALCSCSHEIEQTPDEVTKEMSQVIPENQELFKLIREKDSLLFDIGFNKIDSSQVASLTTLDFEFYHDEHGVTETKSEFIHNIEGIRDLPFKTWRTLVEGSMEVFPLFNDQVLYGAIQNGRHDFYQQSEGKEARKTNTARFTHLWIIENDVWKLKRVLSYDHQVPK